MIKITLRTAVPALLAASLSSAAAQETRSLILSPWGDLLAARHAESVGDAQRALDFYGRAKERGLDDHSDLNSRVYILGLTEGQLDNALAALDKVDGNGNKAPLKGLALAIRAIRDGDFKTAETEIAADESGITRLLAPFLQAWTRTGQKDAEGGIKAFSTPDGQEPTSPLALMHAALIYDFTGEQDKAGAIFDKLAKDADVSVRVAELIGHHMERAGRWDDARALYNKLPQDAERFILLAEFEARAKTKTVPAKDIETAQHGAAEALYGMASALLTQNAADGALTLAHFASQLRPDFMPAALIAAAALQQGERYGEANAIYETVPPTSPFSWLARLNMAENLDRMDMTDRAVAALKVMADEQPTLSKPLIQLGDILRRHDRFTEAADAYSEALKRIGEPSPEHWGIYYSRGICYEQSKAWKSAEADFLKALDLSPDQPLVLNYLGYSWLDQGLNLERSLAMIRKAVDQRPRDGYIVDSLGWGLYRTGNFEGAVKSLERAVMLRPADPIINDHLGDALWRVGRTREARFQWERALDMKPDADLTLELQKKLQDGLPAAAKP